MLSPSSARLALFFCSLALGISEVAHSQDLSPVEVEYRITEAAPRDQIFPAVSVKSAGGFLVWQDARIDTNGLGIAAQLLDGDFQPLNSAFQVNAQARGHQEKPKVAMLAGNGAVVSWMSGRAEFNDVFVRFLSPDGTFLTGDLLVNTVTRRFTTNRTVKVPAYKSNKLASRKFKLASSFRVTRDRNQDAVVAALPDGGALVVYSGGRRAQTNGHEVVRVVTEKRGRDYTNDVVRAFTSANDWKQDVFFQRYSADGRKVGGEVLVNQFATYNQHQPAVAVLPNGGFVISWVSERAVLRFPSVIVTFGAPTLSAQVDIMARVFDAEGAPLGDEFAVNSEARVCSSPAVAASADGTFTIAWTQRDPQRSNGLDIYAGVFSASGIAASLPTRVNSRTYGDQFSPTVAAVGSQNLILWSSMGQDGSWEGVYGQLFSNGTPVGSEFRANTTTLGRQFHPTVASDGVNRFLTVWSGFDLDTDFDLFAQRYLTAAPSAPLAVGGMLMKQQFGAAPAGKEVALSAATARLLATGPAALGEVSLPRMSFSGTVGKRLLHWNTQPGARYQVQVSTDLKSWKTLGEARLASGLTDAVEIGAEGVAAFYRVARLP